MIEPIVVLMIGGGLALLLLLIGIVVSITSERALVEQRLGRYVELQRAQPLSEKERARPLVDWLNRQVERTSYGDRLSRELARADLKLKSGEYVLIIIASTALMGLIFWNIGDRSIVMAILGAIIGSQIPRFYVKTQQRKRLIKFNEQLPDMLNLMVNGLRAGFSTLQAMESVSREMPSPISDEFRRVVQEIQLGVPMDRALDNLLQRIPSDDLDLVITAMNVQREVGGNLAEILDSISFTIRERVRIKGEIRVLTTQVMYSGRFLALLPIILIAVLYLINRPYVMEFFKAENFPCGLIALGVALFLIVTGYFVMNKLGNIEV